MTDQEESIKRISDVDFNTIAGENLEISGRLSGQGNIKIDCRFEGEINVRGIVYIGLDAEVRADVLCERLIVDGRLKGDITVEDKIEVRRTGVLYGNVRCSNMVVEKGSFFAGQFRTKEEDEVIVKVYEEKRKDLLDVGKSQS